MSETAVCSPNPSAHPSERLEFWARFIVVGLASGILALLPGLAWASGPSVEAPPAVKPLSLESYCGVLSLYRALRAVGKEISFADLVKPEYISSKQGSTVADLKRAGNDLGAFVEPMNRMTCGMLREVHFPVILHVKFDLGSNDYNHWVLFMGTEGGRARIYDRDLGATEMGFDELAARGDGTGLLISGAPINRTGIWLATVCPFLLYAGLAAFAVGFLFRVERHWGRTGGKATWAGAVRSSLGQAAGLLIIVLGVAAVYRAVSQEGFLSSPAAIAAIQDSHLGSFLPKVKTQEMARLLDTADVTVVDARLPEDFKAGHLKGAISIPVGSSPEMCQQALVAVPKDNRIVVYSHSNGCPYGEKVSRELISLGYHNILLFKGGWVEWEKYHPLSGKSGLLVKGE